MSLEFRSRLPNPIANAQRLLGRLGAAPTMPSWPGREGTSRRKWKVDRAGVVREFTSKQNALSGPSHTGIDLARLSSPTGDDMNARTG
jgi:hypothetical protein